MPGSVFVQPNNQPPFRVDLRASYNCNNQALIQVTASDDHDATVHNHVPSTVVLVIDVSGSMASPASTYDDSDGASGLSQLDIVKHASRTILESLHPTDALAVVAFASDVRTVFSLAHMTAENRAQAWAAIDELYPTSQTNLYGGLIQALDLMKQVECEHSNMPSNPNIMLLTDGMPNIAPPRGELDSLRNYLDANPALRQVRISTFGFGYNLDSQLLDDIARVGRSLYAFIPDSSFVGTVFVNAVSNILATANTEQMTLKLEAAKGVTITGCTSGQSYDKTHWGLSIELPSLLYGQTIDILVQTSGDDPSKEPFQAFLDWRGLESPLTTYPGYVDAMDPEEAAFCQALVRSEIIQFIRASGRCSSERELQEAQACLADAKKRLCEICDRTTTADIDKMLQDVNGQISEACSRYDWYRKWGVHYTFSLASAHSLQQCSNFKDPGLQTYATHKFSVIRDASEAKFVELPAPKPSRQVKRAVTSMNAYYCASNPCFARGLVHMVDGGRRPIRQVRAGDILSSPTGPAQVRCVVETPIPSGIAGLVHLEGDVLVTPWHPVRVTGAKNTAWKYPYQLKDPQWLPCSSVVSLVLEEGATSFHIGDYDAVSLGHGIRDDPVAKHDYLGTNLVLDDLKNMEGWVEGYIKLPADPVIRDPETHLIVGLGSTKGEEIVVQ